MAKYLSNRVRTFNIGVSGITESDTVLTTIGNSTFTGNITADGIRLGDNDQILLGDGDDLKIFHDGNANYIVGNNGTLNLKSDSYAYLKAFNSNGRVQIYHNNSVKFETTASGVTVTGTALATALSTGASGTGINISTNTISGPSTLTIDPAAVGDNTGTVVIAGDLQIDGTTTTVNSTTMTVDDKNIELGTGAANDAAADGGGITIVSGDGNKTFQFEATGDNLGSSENLNLANTKEYKINNTSVLSATTLGSGVTGSSLTSVGTLGSLTVSGDISISEKIVHTGDTDTQIKFPSDDTIELKTAGSARLTVKSDGKVGVGTAGPLSTFNVNGDVTIGDPGTAGTYLNIVGAGAQEFGIRGGGGPNNPESKFAILGATSDSDLRFRLGGTEYLRLKNTGRLGLGTNNPSELLHVLGTSNTTALVENNSAVVGSHARLQFKTGGSGTTAASAIKSIRMASANSATDLTFETTSGSNSTGEVLRITNAGRVGIGVNSPASKLTVHATDDYVRIRKGANSNFCGVLLDRDSSGTSGGFLGLAGASGQFASTAAQHDFVLRSESNLLLAAGGGSERLRLGTSGQIGLSGTNYGTSGQVITSNGSGSAPTWQDVSSNTITVADESTDTTCFPLFSTDATGSISPKTGSNLTFNSSNGTLTATTFSGSGASLTDLNASNLGSGTVPDARFPATLPAVSAVNLTALTGASAATYGDGTNVAQIVVDSNGRITGITEVSISGVSGAITVQDEGVSLSTDATTLNFVGSGVVASGTGATKTITISGEGVTSVNAADESSDTTCFPLFATSATGSVAAKTDASGLKYDSSNERLETTDVAVKGAVRCENSGSTERFEILYNETTDSLDFTYSAS
jgi:lipopolysaccharide export system protein LptA